MNIYSTNFIKTSLFQPSKFLPILFPAIIGLMTSHCTSRAYPKIIPLEEPYKPDHVIEFPHAVHAGKGIDCKHCHNSKIDEKSNGVPTGNVCLECHKQIKGDSL
jgi:hypothetical protein